MSDALTMAAPDPEERWPDRTITNGQRTLGFVFINDDGSASAAGPSFNRSASFRNSTSPVPRLSLMRTGAAMAEPIRKPTMKVRIGTDGDLIATREVTLQGRFAWCLNELHKAGVKGCTPIERPAPRWSHYVFRLRRDWDVDIETVTEGHSGPYAGSHARYVLRSPVEILEGAMP